MDTKYISVMARHIDSEYTEECLFGVMPQGYRGDGSDLPGDEEVTYWLEHDEPLVAGSWYGDWFVEEVEA